MRLRLESHSAINLITSNDVFLIQFEPITIAIVIVITIAICFWNSRTWVTAYKVSFRILNLKNDFTSYITSCSFTLNFKLWLFLFGDADLIQSLFTLHDVANAFANWKVNRQNAKIIKMDVMKMKKIRLITSRE